MNKKILLILGTLILCTILGSNITYVFADEFILSEPTAYRENMCGVWEIWIAPGPGRVKYVKKSSTPHKYPSTAYQAWPDTGRWAGYCRQRCQCEAVYRDNRPHTYVNNVCERCGHVRPDTTPPTAGGVEMRLTNSTGEIYNADTYTTKNIYIKKINGSDSGSGHKSTDYKITGANTVAYTTSATTISNEGLSKVTVRTKDNAGNTSYRKYLVYIDKTKPVIGGADNTIYTNAASGTLVTPSLNGITDVGAGVGRSIWRVKSSGSPWNLNTSIYSKDIEGTSVEGNIPVQANEGTYVIGAWVRDKAGVSYNTDTPNEQTAEIDFIVDRTPPTFVLPNKIYTKATGNVVTIVPTELSDALSGLGKYDVIFDGTETTNISIVGNAISHIVSVSAEGIHTLQMKVYDRAGNYTVQDAQLIVDRTPPASGTVEMTSGGNNYSGEYDNATWSSLAVNIIKVNAGIDTSPGETDSVTYTIYREANGVTQEVIKTATYSVVNQNVLSFNINPNDIMDPGIGEAGNYQVHVKTIDKAGNESIIQKYRVKIDRGNLVPGDLIMVKVPSGEAYTAGTWTNTNVQINGIADPEEMPASGIESQTYEVDNDGNDRTSVYQLTTDGKHNAVITLIANNGMIGEKEQAIWIDKTLPIVGELEATRTDGVNVSFSNDSTGYSNLNVMLSVTDGSDALSGHNQTTYTISKLVGGVYTTYNVQDNELTENGSYEIVVSTSDNAGNVATRTYILIINKPVATNFNLSNIRDIGIGKVKEISIQVRNNLDEIKYSETKTLTKIEESSLTSHTFRCSLSSGTYVAVITLTDILGNTNQIIRNFVIQ